MMVGANERLCAVELVHDQKDLCSKRGWNLGQLDQEASPQSTELPQIETTLPIRPLLGSPKGGLNSEILQYFYKVIR